MTSKEYTVSNSIKTKVVCSYLRLKSTCLVWKRDSLRGESDNRCMAALEALTLVCEELDILRTLLLRVNTAVGLLAGYNTVVEVAITHKKTT